MVNRKPLVYTVGVVLPAITLALGCGKQEPKQPPPGAPTEEPTPPEVELPDFSSGTPKDPEGDPTGSTSGTGTLER